RGCLRIISVERALRDSIEAEAEGFIGPAWAHRFGRSEHDRDRPPSGTPRWSVDLNVIGKIREQDLPSRQYKHVAIERRVVRRVGRSGHGTEMAAVPLEERDRRIPEARAGHH